MYGCRHLDLRLEVAYPCFAHYSCTHGTHLEVPTLQETSFRKAVSWSRSAMAMGEPIKTDFGCQWSLLHTQTQKYVDHHVGAMRFN